MPAHRFGQPYISRCLKKLVLEAETTSFQNPARTAVAPGEKNCAGRAQLESTGGILTSAGGPELIPVEEPKLG